jgi:hypothetical protein
VAAEIVEDDHVTGAERRCQELLDPSATRRWLIRFLEGRRAAGRRGARNERPLMAPSRTQGAMMPSWRRPATKVLVCQ